MKTNSFENPTVVSPEKWLAARLELLREEKEYTRLGDKLAALAILDQSAQAPGGGVGGIEHQRLFHQCLGHYQEVIGEPTEEANLRLSTQSSLLRAKEKALRSIAFPAVGTGIAGFPMRRAAEVMIEEALKHLQGPTSLEEVRFVLYDRPAFETFREVYEAIRQ